MDKQKQLIINMLELLVDMGPIKSNEMYSYIVRNAAGLLRGSFLPDEAAMAIVRFGQNDKKFKLGETIRYSPSEIGQILKKEVVLRDD